MTKATPLIREEVCVWFVFVSYPVLLQMLFKLFYCSGGDCGFRQLVPICNDSSGEEVSSCSCGMMNLQLIAMTTGIG